MQPNPKPSFSDKNNGHGLLLTWIIVATNMDADMNTYMENYVAACVDNNDVAAYMDDGVAAYVDDGVALSVLSDHIYNHY
jgi:hypothetical protein